VLFRFPRVRVLDVYRGVQGDPREWSHEVGTMDFEALYRERGVPPSEPGGRPGDRAPGGEFIREPAAPGPANREDGREATTITVPTEG
jgi:hypothetical protein